MTLGLDGLASRDRKIGIETLLRRRRMTRTFAGGPSSSEVFAAVETALRAPSAGFAQGVHLVVLLDDDLQEFWTKSRAGDWFAERSPGVLSARYVVLVFGDASEYLDRYAQKDKAEMGLYDAARWQTPYWLVDAGMVVQNLLLLAEDERWGALFFGVHGNQQEYFEELGVPTSAHCVGAVAIGYRSAADTPSGSPVTRKRRETGDLVHIGKWTGSVSRG